MTVLGEKCRLDFRKDKCAVWSKRAMNTIDSRIKGNSREVLEIFCWIPRFVASSIQKRVQKIRKFLEKLEYLNDPHSALGILQSCLGSPKMVYSIRCSTPSVEAVNIFEQFDLLQRTTFERIMGTVLSNES